ncbi:Queuine tRNA-ribosyltransferase accessory subunit 2 [Fulvia fulva]|uniref:Queuine tRNA-ribosyltransferase accessory subunit 2 n=1 Tax=Passalora fulva TaxID=5499 RepID=A0A9Q8UQS7_PASFU|nr:Queuine tRNA-ribosyltransferase accessory subunit 2 [Fulvia fulva]KAK4622270.1 Queuine tRNA-ribosyltransferase accessory subunit 2 [Fulvia fulva]KAK4622764.1 Queuine tRNA-ribosyltransferase accessory subunit 2 [Fulvia fulva]UJO18987.1 Queuine tRNA-ribosyltransferase accessory subunit 2 [Fulvia fulva]WPV16542.1 Queuine tRNA-ribosyltransferase accessory subunit 2 [Fulvia fulva]WPV31759.1 Queuine tRNA-ribosyltransferase accessory subunit 2 [Fulvia fulva]
MNGHVNGTPSQLPDEMFGIIEATGQGLAPRLGRLALPGRRVIDTPHYLGNTSRGVVPHITQDTFVRDTHINAVYVALEDFIEKAPRDTPPLYNFRSPDGASSLRRFIALPEDTLLVLGTRRTPPVLAPAANSNTDKTIAIGTSVGFRTLAAADYADGVEGLGADIVVGLGDIPYGRTPGNKRIEKATDRSIAWLQDHVLLRKEKEAKHQAKLFASLLPVSCAEQQYYIDKIEELVDDVSGLAIHDTSSLEGLPEDLWHLPRLGYTEPASPHDILRQVGLGIDIFAVPFITAATDAGIALDFSFPSKQEATSNGREPSALGIDMWLPTHAVDVSPLSAECECYACTNHHRAYLQHLLAAKEMLGWVLLQIHNHHVIELVFEGIRSSIAAGTFEDDVTGFSNVYESSLPEKTGQGPRIRGYQFKAEGPGEPKKNKAPYSSLNDAKEKLAEATPPSRDEAVAGADGLEAQGFATKQE